MIVMLPCLTIWANAMGILGGALFGVAKADFTLTRYIQASIESLYLRDIFSGLVKSVMFGITITAVGCLEGLSTGGGAEQVGRSTTRAVVISILLVVVVDLVFTGIFSSWELPSVVSWLRQAHFILSFRAERGILFCRRADENQREIPRSLGMTENGAESLSVRDI